MGGDRLDRIENSLGERVDGSSHWVEAAATIAKLQADHDSHQAQSSALVDRMSDLEKTVSDSANRSAKLDAVHVKAATLQQKVEALSSEHNQTATSLLRLDAFAHAFEDSQTRWKSLETNLANFQEERAACCAERGKIQDSVSDLQRQVGWLAQVGSQLDAHHAIVADVQKSHAAFESRLCGVEKRMADDASTNLKLEAAASQIAQAKLDCDAYATQIAALQDRMDGAEQLIVDSSDKHVKWEAAVATVSNLPQMYEALSSHHLALAERIDGIDSRADHSADKHAAWDESASKLIQLEHRHDALSQEQGSLRATVLDMDRRLGESMNLQTKADTKMPTSPRPQDAQLAQNDGLQGRLGYLEGLLGDATGSYDSLDDRILASEKAQQQTDDRVSALDGHVTSLQRALASQRLATMKEQSAPKVVQEQQKSQNVKGVMDYIGKMSMDNDLQRSL